MNWLCNPSGKPGHFRGVDWVVERLNLYIKAWHGGSFSNRTVPRILKESALVETYRKMQVNIEDNFHLKNRTINHSPPDMTRTLSKLFEVIKEAKLHEKTDGRKAKYSIADKINEGLCSAMCDTDDLSVLEEDGNEENIEAEDLLD